MRELQAQIIAYHLILNFSLLFRFPKYRRYVSEIHEEVVDLLSDAKTPIVALYSISDSYYRVII